MKKPPKSVWLPSLMAIYAVSFFIYEFIIRKVGFSPRNLSVMFGAIIMIAAVWWINRRNERQNGNRENGSERNKTNNNNKQ